MKHTFEHQSLQLQQKKPLIYTAMSKHFFYFRTHISKFVLDHGGVPLNPFMIFDYFLTDTVDRGIVREANNNLVHRADELWVFGPISDGVLAEINIAKEQNKPIQYFAIEKSKTIRPISKEHVILEPDVQKYKQQL